MSASEREEKARRIARRKKKRRRKIIILVIEIAVLVLLLIGVFIWVKYGSRAQNILNQIDYQEISVAPINSVTEHTETVRKGYETIALFGVDNEAVGQYESGNSDSIIICAINKDTGEMNMISVYRDSVMDIDGKGTLRKCNAAYSAGGPGNAVNMLNRNLDLNIQNYVAVDFNALSDCIDAVGGVEIDVRKEELTWINMYIEGIAEDTGRKLDYVRNAGVQNLSGIQATAYCRIRYTAGVDFLRATRQRTVIGKLMAKIKNLSMDQVLDLANALAPEISTSFNQGEIIQHALDLRSYSIANTGGFPYAKVTGKTYGNHIGDAVVPCTQATNVKWLYEQLYGDKEHVCSDTVNDISYNIVKKTGEDERSAVDYGAEKYEGASSEGINN